MGFRSGYTTLIGALRSISLLDTILGYSPVLLTDASGALQSTSVVKANEGDPVGVLIDQSQGTKVVETFGLELVPNGYFSTGDLTGFTLEDPAADVQVVNGDAVITVTAAAPNRGFYWSFPSVIGQTYHVPIDVGSGDNSTIIARVGNSPSSSVIGSFNIDADKKTTTSFVATAATTYVTIRPNRTVAGDTATIKSVSTYSYDIEFEGLGPDVHTDPNFDDASAWTAGGEWVVAGDGVATATDCTAAYAIRPDTGDNILAGKTYLATIEITAISGDAFVQLRNNADGLLSEDFDTVGTHTFFTKASVDGTLACRGGNWIGSVTLSRFSLQEVLGNHLTAQSDAQRPTLAAGDMAFDGVDDKMSFTYAGGEIFMRVNSTDTYFATLSGGPDAFDGNYLGLARATVNPNASNDTPTYIDGVLIGTTQQDYFDALADGETHTVNFRYNAVSSWVVAWLGGVTARPMTGTIGCRMYAHDNNGPHGPLTDAERAVITQWIEA